jgi:hypothetical protein
MGDGFRDSAMVLPPCAIAENGRYGVNSKQMQD